MFCHWTYQVAVVLGILLLKVASHGAGLANFTQGGRCRTPGEMGKRAGKKSATSRPDVGRIRSMLCF
jgi:hypothetical protein